MKLSKDKLRDRVDHWVAKFDPAGVRVAPVVDEGRYVEVSPGASAGTAFVSGHVRAEDGAALDQGLDAMAATVCEHDPRTHAQRRSDACGPLGRREAFLTCLCGREDCTAGGERTTAATAVIHVLAEQGTVDGTSDNAGVSARLRDHARRECAQGRHDGQTQADHGAVRGGSGVPAVGSVQGVCAVARSDVPLARMR